MNVNKYLYKLTEQEEDIHSKIIKFFNANPNPDDKQIHSFAEENGINEHELENHIYMLLTDLLKGVGKHKDVPDSKFDQNELRMGIKVEMEHTDNKAIAKEVAKDHLVECKSYYTRLAKMEKECGVKD